MMEDNRVIHNIKELRDILIEHQGIANYLSFAIILNKGGFSRKEIGLNDDDTFFIFNCNNNTQQDLSEKELMDERLTFIGRAMKFNSFIFINDHSYLEG